MQGVLFLIENYVANTVEQLKLVPRNEFVEKLGNFSNELDFEYNTSQVKS